MFNCRMAAIICVVLASLSVGGSPLSSVVPPASPQSESEKTIWHLEQVYWHYVEENNLSAYLALWHRDFLGWPTMSPTPVHKDHITDWITSQTSKGLAFKLLEFKPSAIQLTGDVAVVCYWTRYTWMDKDGGGAERTLRVTHSWIRAENKWEIIGGMSMAEAANLQK